MIYNPNEKRKAKNKMWNIFWSYHMPVLLNYGDKPQLKEHIEIYKRCFNDLKFRTYYNNKLIPRNDE